MADPVPFLGVADPISTLTHLGGAVLFTLLGVRLAVAARSNPLHFTAIVIYVAGVVFALAMSASFHSIARHTGARQLMMVVDHAAIFFLIAASYTPVHVIRFSQVWMRWGVLGIVWAAAIAGIIAKSIFFDEIPEWVGLSLYLGLGWAGLITVTGLYFSTGLKPLYSLLGGALAYTIGAALDFAGVPTLVAGVLGPHEVFHLFVLLGIALHWHYISEAVRDGSATRASPSLALDH